MSILKIKVKRRSDQRAASQDTRHVFSYQPVLREITVSVGDRTIKATPGTMVFLPRDITHPFVIESEHLRILVLLAPAGLEEWSKEFSVPAPALTLPPATEAPYSEIQKMLAAAPGISSRAGAAYWKNSARWKKS